MFPYKENLMPLLPPSFGGRESRSLNKVVTILVCFQMVRLPDFRSHLKSGPFANQPLFDHLKSRLVQI